MRCELLHIHRGALDVARFDGMGNFRSLKEWSEQQVLAPRFYLYETMNINSQIGSLWRTNNKWKILNSLFLQKERMASLSK
jgi:hypothetical protein